MKTSDYALRLAAAFCLLEGVLAIVGWQGLAHLRLLQNHLENHAASLTVEREFVAAMVMAGAITISIAVVTILSFRREVRVRQEAEQLLQVAFAELDQRIRERTNDLKVANQALEVQVREYRRISGQLDRIFALSPDIIFTKGFDGYLKQFNPALEAILGYSREELLAEPFLDFTHPDELAKLTDSFRLSMTKTPGPGLESRCRCKDGSYRWILWNTVAVPEEQLYTGTGLDITVRKLAEDNLEKLRTEQAAILNSVGMGVHCIDVEGRITYENPAAVKLLGYDASVLVGKSAHATVYHSNTDGTAHPIERSNVQATLKDGAKRHVADEIFWRKDGTSFPVEYTCTAIRDERNAIVGAVVVFEDLTDRRRIEASLFQSQKLKTVGRLAGGVAHEFNSILTAIIGQSELMLSDLPSDAPAIINAREIRRAADRAAILTRQLLAYGRKQVLQPEVVDLNGILSAMLGTVRHLMGSDVDVRLIPATGLKSVSIDPGQLEQVLVNIAMNATDAMPNGGVFTLETSNATLDDDSVRSFAGLKPGDYITLTLTDTGTGMTPEAKARVFEPFFSTKGVGNGTGLGLATCYGIIKQSNGHISVYSELEQGTTLRIYLPQAETPVAKKELPQSRTPHLPRGNESILLAEDDPGLLEMAATLLRRQGYTVFTAINGLEALSLKNRSNLGHIDLLLADIVMPHMSGKELSDRITAIYPHTKILLTSAFTENAIVSQGILKNGVKILQKPFTPSALANRVREVLDQPLPPHENHSSH